MISKVTDQKEAFNFLGTTWRHQWLCLILFKNVAHLETLVVQLESVFTSEVFKTEIVALIKNRIDFKFELLLQQKSIGKLCWRIGE